MGTTNVTWLLHDAGLDQVDRALLFWAASVTVTPLRCLRSSEALRSRACFPGAGCPERTGSSLGTDTWAVPAEPLEAGWWLRDTAQRSVLSPALKRRAPSPDSNPRGQTGDGNPETFRFRKATWCVPHTDVPHTDVPFGEPRAAATRGPSVKPQGGAEKGATASCHCRPGLATN